MFDPKPEDLPGLGLEKFGDASFQVTVLQWQPHICYLPGRNEERRQPLAHLREEMKNV